jgi:hypothetical protein
MAYIQNESLVGTKDGANKTFTTVSSAIEIDSVYLKNGQIVDYVFTSPNTIVLDVAPEAIDPLTVSYWNVGSLINSGSPYEIPSTLESLLFRVRTMIGEHYSEEWLDRSITDWLNEAINRVCVRHDFPFMEAEATINTVVGQESYQLPAGLKKVIGVFSGTTELQRADSRESLNGGYTLFNDVIILPQPTAVGERKIRYYRYLPYFVWTDTSTVSKIPRQYEDLLIDYAVMRAKQAEEIYDVAKIHEQAFENGLNRMVLDLTRRIESDWPSIRPVTQLF